MLVLTRYSTEYDYFMFFFCAREVMEKNINYRDIAKEFDLCNVSLFKFVKKKAGAPATMGYKKTCLVFSVEQKAIIAVYLLKCPHIYFGLLPEDVKRLSYQCPHRYSLLIFISILIQF